MNKSVPVCSHRQPNVPMHRGFTLIELVIAMVIVSILAALAIPSYSAYVRKSRRTDAKNALLDMASLEERFFTTNNTYSSTPSDLGYTNRNCGALSAHLLRRVPAPHAGPRPTRPLLSAATWLDDGDLECGVLPFHPVSSAAPDQSC